MKKVRALFLLLCFSSPFSLFAQNYTPFPLDSVVWSLLSDGYFPEFGGVEQITTRYFPAGDTLLQGRTYTQIYRTTNSESLDPAQAEYYGSLREEDRVVYWCYSDISEEQVLYDFNLGVGDTLEIIYGCGSAEEGCCAVIVTGASQIELSPQDTRRVLKFSQVFTIGSETDTVPTFRWIEGIGSTVGLDSRYYSRAPCLAVDPTPPLRTLLCFEENGELLYADPYYMDCYISTGSEEVRSGPVAVRLFPNPFSEQLNVRWPEDAQFHYLELVDAEGAIVGRWKELRTGFSIDTADLPPGVYLVRLFSESGTMTRKVLKIE